jgi:anti-sigma regulatory factor (Ser/Thr protein kinase)
MMTTPGASPRRVVILSDDVPFHESVEQAVRLVFGKVDVSRAHPSGGLSVLKALLGEAGRSEVWLLADALVGKKPAVVEFVSAWMGGGGRGVVLCESVRRLRSQPFFAYSRRWSVERLSSALSAIYHDRGFMALGSAEKPVFNREKNISAAAEKAALVEEIANTLGEAGVQRTRLSRVSSVVDELLMNALYDAPGRRNRIVDWCLEPGKAVRVSWSLFEEECRITVCDPYGTLPADALQKKLDEFMREDLVQVTHTAAAGGGVGLFVVLRAVQSLYVFVRPGVSSEVTASLDFGLKPRREPKRFKDVAVYYSRKIE